MIQELDKEYPMHIRLFARAALGATLLLALLAGTTRAGQPGPGTNTGTGRGFFPNPRATLQGQSLPDQKAPDSPALQPAYRSVTLTNLDGSGYLRGDWANVASSTGE